METNWQKGVEAFQAGRQEEALSLLLRAVEENPQDAEARKFLGAVLAQSGRMNEAIDQLQQAVQLNPHNAQIHYNLGVAQAMNGDSEGAKTSYYAALKLNPQYEQARVALEQMGAPVPSMPEPQPSGLAPTTTEPFASTDAMVTQVPLAIEQKPTAADYFKAILSGGIAALVGAFIWDKFVYYTHIEFGLISVGIGILVGIAVISATGGRRSKGLQILSGLLALWGMLLGYALLMVDEMHKEAATNPELANAHPLVLLITSFVILPFLFTKNPLSLAFVAFGVYEGWKIPGAPSAPPPSLQPVQPLQSPSQAASDPLKPVD